MSRQRCKECRKQTRAVHPLLEVPLCRACQKLYPDRYGFITKTRACEDYRLRPNHLAELEAIERPNPHWKTGPRPMQLFLRPAVLRLAARLYGRAEPYIVALAPFSPDAIAKLCEDPEELGRIGPGRFQDFIAERLEHLGLEVKPVGDIFRKDGGIDLVAYPKPGALPFLLGVQVKHHRSRQQKTGPAPVRDLHGVLTAGHSSFHMGMVVTNTAFTPDAHWFAQHCQRILRLRDLEDLKRWLRGDFVNEAEWREIPERIELAPGISISIPRPHLI